MSTDKITRIGSCQCGNVRYKLDGKPKMLYLCHCKDCQKQSSSAFGMSLIISPQQLEFLDGEDVLKIWTTRGDDGTIKKCAFCSNCGSRIFHGGEDPNEPISIKAGTLDDTEGLTPLAQIWTKSSQPWFEIDRDRYKCFDEEPLFDHELESSWAERYKD